MLYNFELGNYFIEILTLNRRKCELQEAEKHRCNMIFYRYLGFQKQYIYSFINNDIYLQEN